MGGRRRRVGRESLHVHVHHGCVHVRVLGDGPAALPTDQARTYAAKQLDASEVRPSLGAPARLRSVCVWCGIGDWCCDEEVASLNKTLFGDGSIDVRTIRRMIK